MNLSFEITKKQREFIEAQADEVLFGGAAGGGKSFGQLIDALLYALRYPRSKQLILRRTYPELEKSLVRVAQEIFPRDIYSYNGAKHVGKFQNVYRYQSAEYDVIRFDELTHFTEQMYLYLMSRLRGANPFPKSMRSTTNPGGVGHSWVKMRFIDPSPPGKIFDGKPGKRLFIPAGVRDNKFLLAADPGYIERLQNLHERDRRALLYGDWNVFEGQFFTEWREETHVCAPFKIPDGWRRYFAMDYGLDMLAGYWIAVDGDGRAFVYREVYRSGLVVGAAAELIKSMTNEKIFAYIAPPDMWNRRQDSGKSVAEIFYDHGILLTKAENSRVAGWFDLHEWLRPVKTKFGTKEPLLKVFSCCRNLIRSIPALVIDKTNPSDASTEPHEITHGPDAIRYFVAGRPLPASPDVQEDFLDEQEQELLRFGSLG